MREIKCSVKQCASVFMTDSEVCHTVTYVCRNHPRKDQFEAVSRPFDNDRDNPPDEPTWIQFDPEIGPGVDPKKFESGHINVRETDQGITEQHEHDRVLALDAQLSDRILEAEAQLKASRTHKKVSRSKKGAISVAEDALKYTDPESRKRIMDVLQESDRDTIGRYE